MDNEDDGTNYNVSFLYRTMLERDPQKRRVKPVQPHLLQLDFAGLDNSSDDSDFKVLSDDDSEENGETDESNESSDNANSDADASGSDESSISLENTDSSEQNYPSDVEACPLNPVVKDAGQALPVTNVNNRESMKLPKVAVCCVCLGDASVEDNEVVECDGCGVTVHEGCYGIPEMESLGSSASSASTEPWFCDACKNGIKPHCELCPNSGGIFKETDAGRWVHLVCALYVPGVAFGDVDKLNMITLFEMPYMKWGSKECSLCDNEQHARTGVCISCDAGLCRSFFHVTCAQKEGLLSEASPDEDIADPFFAYCKQHADKSIVRLKRRNWLAMQSRIRTFEDGISDKEKLRIQSKLTMHQQKVAGEKKLTLWVPTLKMPRMLLTSANALRQLGKKAELLGIAHPLPELSIDIRKRSHFQPMLSADYVSYFFDRDIHIRSLNKKIKDLVAWNKRLHLQEAKLQKDYDLMLNVTAELSDNFNKLRSAGFMLWRILSSFASGHILWSDAVNFQKLVASPHAVMLQRCNICQRSHDQHLLVKCDKCFKYHHLSCLDPPLLRMPKITRLQGWHCSRCAYSSSGEDNAEHVNANEPRQLRSKIRRPMKYSSTHGTKHWQSKKPRIMVSMKKDDTSLADVERTVHRCRKNVKFHRFSSLQKARLLHTPAVIETENTSCLQNFPHSKDLQQVSAPCSVHEYKPLRVSDSRVKTAVDKEFFYSSRRDPMRRTFSEVYPEYNDAVNVTDDESNQ